jgi:hypothetical protein
MFTLTFCYFIKVLTVRLNTHLKTQNKGKAMTNILTLDQIHSLAPSVFATAPRGDRSENYRFYPTIDVLHGLMKNGFQPVKAAQSKTRDENNIPFTRHILRFRHNDFLGRDLKVGEEIPEIVLLNSHNGTSSYQIDLGIFRLACLNGLIVSSGSYDSIRVRHSGHKDIVNEVIEGSFKIIEDAPKVIQQIEQFKHQVISLDKSKALASAALELRGTVLDVPPEELLRTRRAADSFETGRTIWKTFNVIQENLTRGGMIGYNERKQAKRLRGIKSVDGDTKLNRALWRLTEEMSKIEMKQAA